MIGRKHVRWYLLNHWFSGQRTAPFCVYIWDDHAYIFYDWLKTRSWDKMDWILSLMVNKGYDHAYIFYDWLETRRWDKMDWILSLMVNKGCLLWHILRYMHTFFMIGWKHVGEIRWTEFISLMVSKGCPFLHILDDRAHILYDWLETCRWEKADWILGFMVSKDPLFFAHITIILHMHIFCMIGWKHVGEIRWTESLVL